MERLLKMLHIGPLSKNLMALETAQHFLDRTYNYNGVSFLFEAKIQFCE